MNRQDAVANQHSRSMSATDNAGSSLGTIIRRLSAYIEQETDQIEQNVAFDYRASSEKKSRLLYELNRASRTVDMRQFDNGDLAELARLKKALADNRLKIQAHLTAVRDVSRIMVDLIRNEEADGTYGEQF